MMEQAASNLVTGSSMEPTILQLMEMGFEREQLEKCLRAAFNNPDRAVEYLMSGIPESALPQEGGAAPPAAAPAAAPGSTPAPAATGGANPFPAMPTGGGGANPFPAMPTGGGGGGGGAAADGPFAELRNHPRLPELAAMAAQNPAMLQQILPAIA